MWLRYDLMNSDIINYHSDAVSDNERGFPVIQAVHRTFRSWIYSSKAASKHTAAKSQ